MFSGSMKEISGMKWVNLKIPQKGKFVAITLYRKGLMT